MKRSLFSRRSRSSFACKSTIACKSTALGAAAVVGAVAGGIALSRLLRPSLLPDNPVVLVTGGSRGLGLAIAHRFAQEGARFVLAAEKREELEDAQAKLLSAHANLAAEDFYLVAGDLSQNAECERLINETYRRFGRLDVLINNAGIMEVGPVESFTVESFDKTVAVNLQAAVHICLAALPRLLAQTPAANGHRASIVNIASIGGKFAVPHMLPYTTAKFGLVGFSEGLHAEVRFSGVRVTTVCPGLMRTGGEAHAKFVGNQSAEQQWFDWCATTPGVAVTPAFAANRIYDAARNGRAEITISPQAWLGARFAGLAPETLAYLNALTDKYILPDAPAK